MPKISACVISYNEEDRIEACLESLAPVADEIVVVDSHSTDRTVEIAKKYADRVISQEFLGYIGQKNYAAEQATHDWILSLDCDERLSPRLQAEIASEKQHLGRTVAYDMPRRTFYIDRWIDHAWYPNRGVRFYDRRVGKCGGTEPHDGVILSSGAVGHLDGDILHYTCSSVSQHLQTIDRFSELAAQDMFRNGRRTNRIEPTLRGLAMFIKLYFLKRGFLDGFSGVVVSVLSASEAFARYSKLWYLQRDAEGT